MRKFLIKRFILKVLSELNNVNYDQFNCMRIRYGETFLDALSELRREGRIVFIAANPDAPCYLQLHNGS